jgi:hypothetical protein
VWTAPASAKAPSAPSAVRASHRCAEDLVETVI